MWLILATSGFPQGFSDWLTERAQKVAIPVLGFTSDGTNDCPKTFGTGAIYWISVSPKSYCAAIITAKHNLYYIEANKTNLLDAIRIKLNMPETSHAARFLRIPLKKTSPHNFWFSHGAVSSDLAVIPIPMSVIHGTDTTEVREDQVATAKNYKTFPLAAGTVAVAAVLQAEYLDDLDLSQPTTLSIYRCGHIARIGTHSTVETNSFTRHHLIDIHASPGNSGAVVLALSNEKTALLGLVHGFIEEGDAYRSYEAPVTNKVSLVLVNDPTLATSTVALTIVTKANPNLTLVTPVDELAALMDDPSFLEVMHYAGSLYSTYLCYEQTKTNGNLQIKRIPTTPQDSEFQTPPLELRRAP